MVRQNRPELAGEGVDFRAFRAYEKIVCLDSFRRTYAALCQQGN